MDMHKLLEVAEGTDFANFDKNPELHEVMKEYDWLFQDMDEAQVTRLLHGDYHLGHESHSFGDPEGVKAFVSEVGPLLGWDPESYESEEDEEDAALTKRLLESDEED
jgi:hypothetical protein